MKEKEHQSVEWKQAWRDEYLKWICGYANAYGGTIYIGTDDDGNVIGIDNAKELLELIPSKITDTMGIIADVNLLYKDGLEYLEIIVDKYPSLISFRGKYYYRSGSTMREITGKELERTLLKTQGRTWDGVPLPKLSVTDLKYQDEVHGPLLEQVDKTIDLVYTKYMKARIAYEGIQRIEQFMFHKDAFREILLNAIVHKDYSSCNPIQISVYEDKIYVWNDGEMPPNLDTTDKLFMKHSSKPYNPNLANVFFKSGMIEAWGRGFEKIKEGCALYDGPLPEYDINESGIMVLCQACDRYLKLLDDSHYLGQSDQDNDQDLENKIIEFCKIPKSSSEILKEFNLERSYFRRHYLDRMLKVGDLKRTEPDKPKSRNQKYYS